MQVERWDEARWGTLNEANMRRKLETKGYTVSRYTYPPGTCFPDHQHAIAKVDTVLKGRFRLRMRGAAVVLEPGDMIAVPANTVHSAEVLGDESVVSLDACKV